MVRSCHDFLPNVLRKNSQGSCVHHLFIKWLTVLFALGKLEKKSLGPKIQKYRKQSGLESKIRHQDNSLLSWRRVSCQLVPYTFLSNIPSLSFENILIQTLSECAVWQSKLIGLAPCPSLGAGHVGSLATQNLGVFTGVGLLTGSGSC